MLDACMSGIMLVCSTKVSCTELSHIVHSVLLSVLDVSGEAVCELHEFIHNVRRLVVDVAYVSSSVMVDVAKGVHGIVKGVWWPHVALVAVAMRLRNISAKSSSCSYHR